MTRLRLPLTAALVLACGCDAGPGASIPDFDAADAEPRVAQRVQDLRAVVAAHPDSAPAWGLLALSLQAHGYPEAAVEAYAAAASLRPGTFAYVYLPATILGDRGDADAGRLFARARDLRPRYVPLRLREAAWQLDQGRPAQVAELLNDSLVLEAAPVEARLTLARASLGLGDLEESRSLLEDAAAGAPRMREVHGQLAEVYRRLGLTEQAELARFRSRTFREEPRTDDPVLATLYAEGVSSRWYILRGQGHLAAGEPAEAIGSFEEAIGARPDDAHGWNQLGIALQADVQYEAAAAAHRRALELRPGFADAAINLASDLFLGGDRDAGLRVARQAVEMDTTAAQAYLNLGMFEHALGRPGNARAAYASGLARAEFDVRIAIRLAWLMATDRSAARRDGRRAVVLAETVNEIEGYGEPASLDVLAAAYAEYGAFDNAVAAARRAESIASRNGNPELAAAIGQRTSLYVAGTAYRE